MAYRASCASAQSVSAIQRLGLICACALALASCGGDDEKKPAARTAPEGVESIEVTSTSPRTASTEEKTPPPGGAEHGGREQEQEGGAGDEEEARVPVRFTVREGGVEPPQVGVPGFLALELIVANRTSQPVVARFEGEEPLTAGPGETARLRIAGRRPGRYPVDFGAAGQALLVTGVEPGP